MIIRAKHNGKTAPYTILSRELIQENKLPYGAKCLLLLMLSYPDTWNFTEQRLAEMMSEDIQTILNWLAVLEQFGYFHRDVVAKIGNTTIPANWLVSEFPIEVKE